MASSYTMSVISAHLKTNPRYKRVTTWLEGTQKAYIKGVPYKGETPVELLREALQKHLVVLGTVAQLALVEELTSGQNRHLTNLTQTFSELSVHDRTRALSGALYASYAFFEDSTPEDPDDPVWFGWTDWYLGLSPEATTRFERLVHTLWDAAQKGGSYMCFECDCRQTRPGACQCSGCSGSVQDILLGEGIGLDV